MRQKISEYGRDQELNREVMRSLICLIDSKVKLGLTILWKYELFSHSYHGDFLTRFEAIDERPVSSQLLIEIVKMSDESGKELSLRYLPFKGKKDEWEMWSAKFMSKAGRKGTSRY